MDYPPAMVNLGAALELAHGHEMEAIQWFKQGAAKDYAPAEMDLGMALMKGSDGVKIDLAEACHWFDKAKAADPQAYSFHCGCMKRNGKSEEEFATCLAAAAQAGDASAQNNVAIRILAQPIGNVHKAMDLLEQAAEQGSMEAQFNLALSLEGGIAGNKEPARARFWYQRAAEQSDGRAMFNLGSMLEAGRGGPASETQASVMFDGARKLGVTQRVEVPATGVVPEITAYEISHGGDLTQH